jgi:heat shock protein HslJ
MKRIFFIAAIFSFIVPAVLSACSSNVDGLGGTNWKLSSYGPSSAQQPAVPDVETNLSFGMDGKMTGKLGCNSIGGNYSTSGQQINFTSVIATKMACDEPQMTQENTALQVLNGTVSFVLAGQAADTLIITSSDGNNSLTFVQATDK